jgi:curved DNA-binding protein CbpA
MSEPDYYDILGVDDEATQEEIKAAYKALAKKYHPDKNNGKDEMFKKIAEANSVLSDPQRRQRYDEILISGGSIDDIDNPKCGTNGSNDKFFNGMGSFNEIFNQPFFRQNSVGSRGAGVSSRSSVSNRSGMNDVSDMFGLENIPNIPGLPNIAEILRMAGIGNLANLTKGVPNNQSRSFTQSFTNNGFPNNNDKTIYAGNDDSDTDDLDSSDNMFSSSESTDSIEVKRPVKRPVKSVKKEPQVNKTKVTKSTKSAKTAPPSKSAKSTKQAKNPTKSTPQTGNKKSVKQATKSTKSTKRANEAKL